MPRQGRETAALRDFKPAYVADGSKPVGLRLRTTIPLHPRKQTYRLQQPARSRKHRRTSLGELHVGPALVQPEPALGEGALKTRLVFHRRALELIQERPTIRRRSERPSMTDFAWRK